MKPQGIYILAKPIKEEKKKTLIIIESEAKENQKAEVMDIGQYVTEVNIGDIIYFRLGSDTIITDDNAEELILVSEEDILLKIKK